VRSPNVTYVVSASNKVVRPIFFGEGLDKVEEIQQAAQTLRQEFKTIDERLAGSHWLVGDKISAADIGTFPLVQLILRATSKEAAQPLNLGLLPLELNELLLTELNKVTRNKERPLPLALPVFQHLPMHRQTWLVKF